MGLFGKTATKTLQYIRARKPRSSIGASLSAALLLLGCSSAKLEDHLPIYEGWCSYQIELGERASYRWKSIDECVNEYWTQRSNLHEDYADLDELYQAIGFDMALRQYCEVENLEYNYCKTLIAVSGIASQLAPYLSLEDSRSWRSSGYQETYVINGQVYNDPYGIDYKNGPNDVYGDGR
jgi:hypothetical protein